MPRRHASRRRRDWSASTRRSTRSDGARLCQRRSGLSIDIDTGFENDLYDQIRVQSTGRSELPGTKTAAAGVVVAELGPVDLARLRRLVERRRVPDLVLRPVDEYRLRIRVDPPDHARGHQHLLAEQPRARVDDDV